ncbi:hypothetical protein M422DRAFT_267223 [Sphaerobolus stellatus SS14]|uniref:DUF6533 domain-containing protein n=1 Tax=Sphaerobolus stellatus (strain SS14) TaxID=990650 RepID=A0A0C9V137_SPHS4|nr:hypothetical protein M422DRAFT_267223 [Sphaerobolus stellatus SS14]
MGHVTTYLYDDAISPPLPNTLFHIQIYRYFTCVALTLLIYNYLITFEQERVHVWKQAKTLPFYIFLVLRYFPLIVLIIAFDFHYVLLAYSRLVAPIVLIPNNRELSTIRIALAPVITATSGGLLPLSLSAISFDLVIFYLTLRKGLEARAKETGSTLLKVLVRGGNLYFMSLSFVNFLNVLLIALTVKTFGLEWGFNSVFPWIGDYIGNINVQLTSVITSVIVSHLFLDLREAAYRSHKSYNNPSAITATVGEWFNFNQSESGQSDPSGPNIQPGSHTRENQFIGQSTLQGLMGYEDFAVDLQHFDDGDYNSMSENNEAL